MFTPALSNKIVSFVSCLRNAIVSSALKENSKKRAKEVQTNDELRRVQENFAADSASQKPWKIRNIQE